MLMIKGCALVATDPVDLRDDGVPMSFRTGTLYDTTCPLFIRDEQGRLSTSFECDLIARDGYYALNIELPEGDEEANMVADYVMAGYDGIELQVDLTRKVMRWSEDYGVYLDVLEFIPRSVFLVKDAPAVPYWAWVEEDNQVNYELPEECKALMFSYYEYDHRVPAPIAAQDDDEEDEVIEDVEYEEVTEYAAGEEFSDQEHGQ